MHKRGFTLIEMMVAVGLFVVVALISTSALIAISKALRRAQNVRTVIEATGIAMDSMTLRMVTKSSKFFCSPGYTLADCVFTTGRSGIQFTYGVTTYRYDYDTGNRKITLTKNPASGGLPADLTPPTISIDDLAFYVQNNSIPKISNVTILMRASAKADPSASVIIQTSIAAR